jgi:hypothetical protein
MSSAAGETVSPYVPSRAQGVRPDALAVRVLRPLQRRVAAVVDVVEPEQAATADKNGRRSSKNRIREVPTD